MRVSIFIFLALITAQLSAQKLVGFSSYYNDAFHEWEIITDDEDLLGEIENDWHIQGRWDSWHIRIGDLSGQIRSKWRDDPNAWDITLAGETVRARTVFRNQFDRWEVRGKNTIIDINYDWTNDQWVLRTGENDISILYTEYVGDPRDWVIHQSFENEYSPALEIGSYFIPILFNTHTSLR